MRGRGGVETKLTRKKARPACVYNKDTAMLRTLSLILLLTAGFAVGVASAGAEFEPLPRTPEPRPPARPQPPAPVPPAPQVVARFTTRYEPGEPRVTNIRRAAELLDGTVLTPGERFSMNEALGERTTARGFVPAPMILGNRMVDSVGGGISQVATALYNAAFFAGLELLDHTPHSYYFDRYPIGREATVSWGGPELVFRNDWSAPLRMLLRTTTEKLTVTFLSAPLGRRIETRTGEPRTDSAGFTIEYTRRVYRYDRLTRDERFRVRYATRLPEN